MRTIRKVSVRAEHSEIMPDYETFEDGVIYISDKYKTSIHKCLCGCGEKIVLPINCIIDGKDLGWKFTESDKGISFTPSVGNYQLPCRSHYIITNNVANFV